MQPSHPKGSRPLLPVGLMVLALGTLGAFFSLGASLGDALDLRAVLLTVAFPAALTTGLYGRSACRQALRAALSTPSETACTPDRMAVLLTARRAALAGGGIGLLLGLVEALQTAPPPGSLPAALAPATLVLVWALIVGEVVLGTLARRLATTVSPAVPLPGPLPAAGLAALGLVLWLPAALSLGPSTGEASPSEMEVHEAEGEFVRRPSHGGATTMSLAPMEVGLRHDPAAPQRAGSLSFQVAIEVADADADALEALLLARGPQVRETLLLLAADFSRAELSDAGGLLLFRAECARRVEALAHAFAPTLTIRRVTLEDLAHSPPVAPGAP